MKKNTKKLVSLKEAVQLLNEVYSNDPQKSGRDIISLKTLYNKIHLGKLKRHGPRHFCQVDADEILDMFGPRSA